MCHPSPVGPAGSVSSQSGGALTPSPSRSTGGDTVPLQQRDLESHVISVQSDASGHVPGVPADRAHELTLESSRKEAGERR